MHTQDVSQDFSKGVLSKLLWFVLKSEIHISEQYVKIGTTTESYSFSHKFGERLE